MTEVHNDPSVVREAVAVFRDAESLQEAIDDLLSSGFNRADISLLAAEDTVKRKLGHAYNRVEELEDDPNAPTTCYVSPESVDAAQGAVLGALTYVGAILPLGAVVASGGALAAGLAAALLGGSLGGAAGTIIANMIGDENAERVQEQLSHGGLLLWVRTWNDQEEQDAKGILAVHSGQDVHVHTLPAPQPLPA